MGYFSKESTFHEVQVVEDSRLHSILGATRLSVNTTHHQAVRSVAAGLVASAISTADGVVEGIEAEGDWFLVGVQWHPERMKSDRSQELFGAFVEAAGCRKSRS
jgi:putative glutamine amidotransferase